MSGHESSESESELGSGSGERNASRSDDASPSLTSSYDPNLAFLPPPTSSILSNEGNIDILHTFAPNVTIQSTATATTTTLGLPIDENLQKKVVDTLVLNEKVSEIQPVDRFQIEDYTQCSKSHLWKLMMSFYDRKGPDSWSQGIVPHFITCNAFIGKSYAKVLHGFLTDSLKPGATLPVDMEQPLYIIELGAGSGKFSYFMLKALEEMKGVCGFPFERIIYVMTDFTESNFKFWQNHSALKPYFDSGRLDAAIFDAVEDSSIKLWRSGVVLSQGSVANPVCIVANYLFDTLYHDIFQVSMSSFLFIYIKQLSIY